MYVIRCGSRGKYLLGAMPLKPRCRVASAEGGRIEWGGMWGRVSPPQLNRASWFPPVAGNALWHILKSTERSFLRINADIFGARLRFGGMAPSSTYNRACRPTCMWCWASYNGLLTAVSVFMEFNRSKKTGRQRTTKGKATTVHRNTHILIWCRMLTVKIYSKLKR